MPLGDSQCLALVERGATRHPLDRALLLAAVAEAGVDWADRPLGQRNARLLALRCEWFGPWFDAVLACQACAKLLSLHVDLRAIGERAVADDSPVSAGGASFRRPTTRDLAALVGQPDIASATSALLRRLALGEPGAHWTDAERSALDGSLDDADPLAHIALEVDCEHCACRFTTPLDIGASLWDELAAQAERVIDDVHVLAAAYSWSEAEILAMSTARRALYKQRAGA